MSDTTDDLEASGYDGEEDDFESEELEQIHLLKNEISKLKKMFYGLNIKITALEKRIK